MDQFFLIINGSIIILMQVRRLDFQDFQNYFFRLALLSWRQDRSGVKTLLTS